MASGVDARLMRATKFPPEFSQKVDTQKVNLDIMKTWVALFFCSRVLTAPQLDRNQNPRTPRQGR